MATLKQVGDEIRARIKAARAGGALPPASYNVRVSNSKKSGPAVNITIDDYGELIGDVEDKANREAWFANQGRDLRDLIDTYAGRDRYEPALGGVTKFGVLMISARVTGVTLITTGGTRP